MEKSAKKQNTHPIKFRAILNNIAEQTELLEICECHLKSG
jgi:hypothetical protein